MKVIKIFLYALYICIIFICMYVCMYLTVTINSHCTPVTQFYWYSTVTCDYWGGVLFFIASTNFIAFINQLNILYNFKLVCGGREVCVCVCVGVRIYWGYVKMSSYWGKCGMWLHGGHINMSSFLLKYVCKSVLKILINVTLLGQRVSYEYWGEIMLSGYWCKWGYFYTEGTNG
jgi:hypothetical protein